MAKKGLKTKNTLNALSIEELTKKLKESRIELDKLVLNILQKQEKNVKKPGVLKKEIARLLTTIRQKELSL